MAGGYEGGDYGGEARTHDRDVPTTGCGNRALGQPSPHLPAPAGNPAACRPPERRPGAHGRRRYAPLLPPRVPPALHRRQPPPRRHAAATHIAPTTLSLQVTAPETAPPFLSPTCSGGPLTWSWKGCVLPLATCFPFAS